MASYKMRMPDGGVYSINGPEDAKPDAVRAAILAQFPESGKAQAPSLMRRIAEYDKITGPVTEAFNLIGTPFTRAGDRKSAETAAKMVVPQSAAQWGMLALGPAGRAAGAALAPASKLLMPALGQIAGSAMGGGLGGAAEGLISGEGAGEGAASGAMAGGVSGLIGEGLGALGGKVVRTLGQGSIKKDSLRGVIGEMRRAVPALQGAPVDTNKLNVYVNQNHGGEALSGMMRDTTDTITRRIRGQDVVVPVLGPEPRPVAQAWKELSAYGNTGYGGYKDNPTLRVITGLEPREVWQQGMYKELPEALLKADPSGHATKILDQARRQYSTGIAYLDMLKDALQGEGGRVQFDPSKLQQYLQKEQGALKHGTEFGETRGGKMAQPDRTITTTQTSESWAPDLGSRAVPPTGEPFKPPDYVPPAAEKLSVDLPGHNAFDPLVNTATRGGGLGTYDYAAGGPYASERFGSPKAAGLSTILRFLIPESARMSYAGKIPYVLPPIPQTLLDTGLFKLIDPTRREEQALAQ